MTESNENPVVLKPKKKSQSSQTAQPSSPVSANPSSQQNPQQSQTPQQYSQQTPPPQQQYPPQSVPPQQYPPPAQYPPPQVQPIVNKPPSRMILSIPAMIGLILGIIGSVLLFISTWGLDWMYLTDWKMTFQGIELPVTLNMDIGGNLSYWTKSMPYLWAIPIIGVISLVCILLGAFFGGWGKIAVQASWWIFAVAVISYCQAWLFSFQTWGWQTGNDTSLITTVGTYVGIKVSGSVELGSGFFMSIAGGVLTLIGGFCTSKK
jgi:hypothetical protein